MNASIYFLVYGITPLGSLLGGILGQGIGLQRTLVIAAFGEMLACLWLLFSPVKRLRQQPAPVEPN